MLKYVRGVTTRPGTACRFAGREGVLPKPAGCDMGFRPLEIHSPGKESEMKKIALLLTAIIAALVLSGCPIFDSHNHNDGKHNHSRY